MISGTALLVEVKVDVAKLDGMLLLEARRGLLLDPHLDKVAIKTARNVASVLAPKSCETLEGSMQVLQRQSDEAKESTCKEYDRFGSHSVLGSNKIPNSREKSFVCGI